MSLSNPKVLGVIGSFDGCAMWRIIQPILALNKRGYPCAWRDRYASDIDRQTLAADMIVLERVYWMPGHTKDMDEWFWKIHNIKKRRIVIYETDDDVITPDSANHIRLFHPEWSDDDVLQHRNMTLEVMKRCDAITTTNHTLAGLLSLETGRPAFVLPNAIPWAEWRKAYFSKPRSITGKIVIGWIGGSRVPDDCAPMIEAWSFLAKKYDNIHFVTVNTMQPEYIQMLPPDRITVRDWVRVQEYPHQYVDLDIACCPLADLPFNYKKSPCKAFEAGAAECAVVASPVIYEDVITNGKNGLIAENVDQWIGNLTMLIENEKYRKTLARRWSHQVNQRHNLENTCWQWPTVWRKVYEAATRDKASTLVAV